LLGAVHDGSGEEDFDTDNGESSARQSLRQQLEKKEVTSDEEEAKSGLSSKRNPRNPKKRKAEEIALSDDSDGSGRNPRNPKKRKFENFASGDDDDTDGSETGYDADGTGLAMWPAAAQSLPDIGAGVRIGAGAGSGRRPQRVCASQRVEYSDSARCREYDKYIYFRETMASTKEAEKLLAKKCKLSLEIVQEN
jgi:hypothetical protein